MKTMTIRTTLILTTCLLVGGFAWSPAHADDKSSDRSYGSADVAPALSVPQVIQKLGAAGYQQIEKIQRKRDRYEVRATGRDGARVKLYVNAQTGEILGPRDAGKHRSDTASVYQKLMGDCNQRRCRDDLPTPPGAATGKP